MRYHHPQYLEIPFPSRLARATQGDPGHGRRWIVAIGLALLALFLVGAGAIKVWA